MNKTEYKKALIELLEENEDLKDGNSLNEAIYIIDNIVIYGGFEYGSRGYDHNILLFKGVSWDDIINWGVLVVPETQYYFSDNKITKLSKLGYDNLPISEFK